MSKVHYSREISIYNHRIVENLLKENDIKGILDQKSKEIESRLSDIEGSIDDIRDSLNEIQGGSLNGNALDKVLDNIVGAYNYFFKAMNMMKDLETKVGYEDNHAAPDWPGRNR